MILKTFSASWCVPCKTQKPIIQEWAKAHPDVKVEVVSVESPEGAAMASQFFVQSVPSHVFISESGTVLAAQPGMRDSRGLDAMHEEAKRMAVKSR